VWDDLDLAVMRQEYDKLPEEERDRIEREQQRRLTENKKRGELLTALSLPPAIVIGGVILLVKWDDGWIDAVTVAVVSAVIAFFVIVCFVVWVFQRKYY
jgi:hypothetical protein